MSLIPCITLANLTTPVTQLGGVGNDPTFSTITAETIQLNGVNGLTTAIFQNTQVNDIVVALIGTETGTYPVNQSGNVNTQYLVRRENGIVQSLGASGFDTLRTTRVNNQYDYRIFNGQGGNTPSLIIDGFGELNAANSDVYASTVTTKAVYIDSQVLTADNDQLFLNGIPVATSANISSIADWSLYAQVSTLDGNNQNIQAVNNIQAFSGNFQSLTTTVLTVNTVVSQSTITNLSTINTVDIIADLGNISTLTGSDLTFTTLNGQANFTSTLTLGETTTGLLSVNGAGALLYNGSTITAGSGGSSSNWSAFPATQTVNFNTFGINNGGAFNAASLATSGNIFSLGSMSAAANITGNNVTGTNGVFGSGVNVSGNVNSAGITTGTITASGLVNCQDGLNAVGTISLIGNVGDTVKLSTDANATGIRLQAGAMLLTTAAAFSLNAGGAGNLAAGGAISIAAGDYVDINAGHVDFIGGSEIRVNTIKPYGGSLGINSSGIINAVNIVNGGTVYTNGLSAPSIVPSLAGQTSSIVGIDLIANSNSFIARNMVASTLTVSTITGNTIFLRGLETASIDQVSTLNASTITTNTIRVNNIETASIENVSSITVSTINGLQPGAIWKSGLPANGSYYERVNIAVPINTNTQLISQSVVVTSPTARYMIVAQGNTFTNNVNQILYATIARHTASTGTAALNLSGFTTPTPNTMANAMNLSINNRMWVTASSLTPFPASVVCNVVDSPGVGTWWYSLWVYIVNGTSANQQVFLSILQVAP